MSTWIDWRFQYKKDLVAGVEALEVVAHCHWVLLQFLSSSQFCLSSQKKYSLMILENVVFGERSAIHPVDGVHLSQHDDYWCPYSCRMRHSLIGMCSALLFTFTTCSSTWGERSRRQTFLFAITPTLSSRMFILKKIRHQTKISNYFWQRQFRAAENTQTVIPIKSL